MSVKIEIWCHILYKGQFKTNLILISQETFKEEMVSQIFLKFLMGRGSGLFYSSGPRRRTENLIKGHRRRTRKDEEKNQEWGNGEAEIT